MKLRRNSKFLDESYWLGIFFGKKCFCIPKVIRNKCPFMVEMRAVAWFCTNRVFRMAGANLLVQPQIGLMPFRTHIKRFDEKNCPERGQIWLTSTLYSGWSWGWSCLKGRVKLSPPCRSRPKKKVLPRIGANFPMFLLLMPRGSIYNWWVTLNQRR